MTSSEQTPAAADSASELLSRRAQLQEWLRRLDDVGVDIPAQVARRVRADYEQRLAAVVGELSTHSDSLSADREQLDERLLAAAERHDLATDALEEARLRHRIGELSEEDWESRRPALDSELDAAGAERVETEREIAALEELLTQITDSSVDAETAVPSVAGAVAPAAGGTPEEADVVGEELPELGAAPAATAEEFVEASDEWVPELPELETPSGWEPLEEMDGSATADQVPTAGSSEPLAADEPLDVSAYRSDEQADGDDDLVEITNFAAAAEALADEVDPTPKDDDYAFLQELDRAIAATAPPADASEDSATRPQPGLKCPDCGYSNDPAAWYCGVCGVDLG